MFSLSKRTSNTIGTRLGPIYYDDDDDNENDDDDDNNEYDDDDDANVFYKNIFL